MTIKDSRSHFVSGKQKEAQGKKQERLERRASTLVGGKVQWGPPIRLNVWACFAADGSDLWTAFAHETDATQF